jgi:hypothetical protein
MKGIQQRCMTSEFKQRGEDRKATKRVVRQQEQVLTNKQAKQAAKKMARKETKAAQKAAMVSLG